MINEGDEFRVLEEWNGLDPGEYDLYVRVEEVYMFDGMDFAALSNDASSLEVDVLINELERAIEDDILREDSRHSSMHN